jgi:hypothetical protein
MTLRIKVLAERLRDEISDRFWDYESRITLTYVAMLFFILSIALYCVIWTESALGQVSVFVMGSLAIISGLAGIACFGLALLLSACGFLRDLYYDWSLRRNIRI